LQTRAKLIVHQKTKPSLPMPLAIEITLNIFWIPLICLIFALGGFIFRSSQIARLRHQVRSLEKQNLQSDAEILVLQKENVALNDQLKNNPVPVIPLSPKESPDNLPDASSRKKLLGKSAANQRT
jgi:hypothetical protein